MVIKFRKLRALILGIYYIQLNKKFPYSKHDIHIKLFDLQSDNIIIGYQIDGL